MSSKHDVVYIRTSSEEQNPENQLSDCLSLCKVDSPVVIEDKQSAWKEEKERAGFDNLKKLISQRKVVNLYVWDLDRIYRNRRKLKQFFEYCKIYGCHIHSHRQRWLEQLSDLPQPFNEIFYDFLIEVMGWLAEDESAKKSDRVKAAVRKRGDVTVSRLGNRWGRKPLSTQKVNKIVELRNRGMSMKEISKDLNISVGVVHKTLTKVAVAKSVLQALS